MATEGGRSVRQGQAHKRAAILAAAKELFVQTSVERTSMDENQRKYEWRKPKTGMV